MPDFVYDHTGRKFLAAAQVLTNDRFGAVYDRPPTDPDSVMLVSPEGVPLQAPDATVVTEKIPPRRRIPGRSGAASGTEWPDSPTQAIE